MSKTKAKETTVVEAAGVTVRPVQFEWTVVAHIEKDGKIVSNDGVKDTIMEAGFNGETVESLVAKAQAALEQKYGGG